MASLKDLRDRIDSVKATQKITKAMQMVAAAKLRRAQAAAAAARPYSDRLEAALADAAANIAAYEMPALMRGRGRDKTHLAVICTSDRGLCGGFNVQIVRLARAFLRARRAEGKKLMILAAGKKGADMLKREFGAYFVDNFDLSRYKTVAFEQARAIADDILLRYDREEFDVCTLFYSKFQSVISQEPQQCRLIPCARAEGEAQAAGGALENAAKPGHAAQGGVYYEYEPDAANVLGDLALQSLRARLFRALLENAAGEMGAKMTAMDNASRNAGDMINGLSVTYNRRRQARITTELIEIIAGAEAL